MPRIDIKGLDELIAEMAKEPARAAAKTDAMLLAGAEAVKKGWQQSAKEHGLIDTGALFDAIGYAGKPKKLGDVKFIEIYPQGVRSDGRTRQAMVAYVLHYGTTGSTSWRSKARLRHKKYAGRPGIPASHWVDRAEEISETPRVEAMVKIWKEE